MPSVFLIGLQYQNLELKKIGHENSIVSRGRNLYFIGKIMGNLMIFALLYKRVLELYYVISNRIYFLPQMIGSFSTKASYMLCDWSSSVQEWLNIVTMASGYGGMWVPSKVGVG